MRLYCPAEIIGKDTIVISSKKEIRYMATVLRLKNGDVVEVFDGKSAEYKCKIKSLSKDKAELAILGRKQFLSSNALQLTLACAIPKKAKMDFIVEKATELGVDTIIPLHTHRTIVELSGERAEHRLQRWQAIAKEASQQCGRIKLPMVEAVAEFSDIVKRIKEYDMALIPYLGAGNQHIKDVAFKKGRKSILVFIGPEGDFSEEEIALAKENGCHGISLGELTLKVDTAAIAVVAFLKFSYYQAREFR